MYKTQMNWRIRKSPNLTKQAKSFVFKEKEGFFKESEFQNTGIIAIYCFVYPISSCHNGGLGLSKVLTLLYHVTLVY